MTISDGNESIAAEPVVIRVENVVPSILSSVESSFDRDVITVSGTVLDPGKDVSLVDVDFGDGVKRPAIVRDDKTFSLEHRYEDSGTYDVMITVDDLDGGLGQTTSQWRIDTEAPSDLILSSDLRENIDTSAGNVLVGQIDVVDATPIDDHTLELVAGIGDSDDFELIGDELHLKQGVNVDYETKPSYTIRVLATDLAGNSVERDLTISVVNLPEVSGFTVNDGSAQRSRIRGLRIQFDQIVEADDDAFSLIGPDNSPVPVVVERVHENLMTTVWLTLPASR
ncbi:MAG: PKD domain-containing protein, partial [Planctomycetota bacterium]